MEHCPYTCAGSSNPHSKCVASWEAPADEAAALTYVTAPGSVCGTSSSPKNRTHYFDRLDDRPVRLEVFDDDTFVLTFDRNSIEGSVGVRVPVGRRLTTGQFHITRTWNDNALSTNPGGYCTCPDGTTWPAEKCVEGVLSGLTDVLGEWSGQTVACGLQHTIDVADFILQRGPDDSFHAEFFDAEGLPQRFATPRAGVPGADGFNESRSASGKPRISTSSTSWRHTAPGPKIPFPSDHPYRGPCRQSHDSSRKGAAAHH